MNDKSTIEQLRQAIADGRLTRDAILSLSDKEAEAILKDWNIWGRDSQFMPEWDWYVWLIKAGRGFGKTRVGAETVRIWIENNPIVHLVGATAGDVRDIMVEGPSGLLNIFPKHQRPYYEPSKRKLTFHNGSIALLFTAEEPSRLRGPQCYKAWCDEIASWKYPDETWDNMEMGCRLGTFPQIVATSTPRPINLVRTLLKSPSSAVTNGSTFENAKNLASSFITRMREKYEGTTLGRQELYAELLEDVEGALWTNGMIESNRVAVAPDLRRIVVAIDPATTSTADSDETGIVAAGIANDGEIYVLRDVTDVLSPNDWARRAIGLHHEIESDVIVAEVNQGGDMVQTIIHGIDRNVRYKKVHATKGKRTRAEPIVALYEQGKVHHVGTLPKLENEMTTWAAMNGDPSPNRIDALVWAITELMTPRGTPTAKAPRIKAPWRPMR